MPFVYERTIRLAETDAAGIVYFANYLGLCHEAYEAALAAAGLPVQSFLGGGDVIVPISRSSAEYLRPLQCGDPVRIAVTPSRLSATSFAIDYAVTRLGPPAKSAARVRTEHVVTSRSAKSRVDLPPALAAWVDAG
ncbi:MAG: hypothetical protein RIS54_1884 [Verrucomicrobiota bacterium]|jgi:1,4-dihydroxy-2-naphthoyl-CoA hydrolase